MVKLMQPFSHHAEWLVGFASAERDEYLASHHPAAEVVWHTVSRLRIADVRELITHAHQRPQTGAYRLFVVTFESTSMEAQHALLKLLEDPPSSSCVALVTPATVSLLPTVRSRLQIRETSPGADQVSTTVFSEFRDKSVAARLADIASAHKAADEAWFRDLRSGAVAFTRKADSPRMVTRAVLLLEQYFEQPGASRKLLCEHLALVLPSGAR